jgi:hypothetical protein
MNDGVDAVGPAQGIEQGLGALQAKSIILGSGEKKLERVLVGLRPAVTRGQWSGFAGDRLGFLTEHVTQEA